MQPTTAELMRHLQKYHKATGETYFQMLPKLVEIIVEEGIGASILGSFDIADALDNTPMPAPKPNGPRITAPRHFISTHKTGSLDESVTVGEINRALQGKIKSGSGDKSRYDWQFLVDGEACGIWDYKGARWSTYGPASAFEKIGLVSRPNRW